MPALLLLLTLVVDVWPTLLPWRAQTLHEDLPWAGLAVAVVGLALAAALFLSPSGTARLAGCVPRVRHGLVLAVAATTVLVALIALPTILATSRAGLTVRTGSTWGAPSGTVDPRPARRLELGEASGGPWGRESFFADVSGRI